MDFRHHFGCDGTLNKVLDLIMIAQIAGRAIVLIGAAITASGITASVMHYVNRSKVQKARDAGKREGEAREKARQEEVRRQSNAAQAEMLATFVENQALIWLALALVTVGAACVGSFGPVSSDDQINIEEYALGVSRIGIPDYVRAKMSHAFSNPTDIKTAYAQAAKCAETHGWGVFDDLVQLMAAMNAREPGQGFASFASEWHYLRAAA